MRKIIYLLSATTIVFVSIAATAQNISTLAGTVASGYSGDGGPATAGQLFHPKNTAVDDTGNVYIADADNNVIRKVTPAGVISTIAGYPGGGFSGDGGLAVFAGLSRPDAIVIDHAHNMYISDADNQRIRKINTAGIISTIVGDGTAGFLGDGGLGTAAEINYPGGIALDKHGNLYITDEYNNRIRKVDPTGTITTFAGNGTTGYPGDVELADTAGIGFPFGIAVDTNDNVYFSLTLDNRICKINTAHILTSIAGVGGGTGGYSGDGGPATAAQFDNPWGIGLDVFGNLYIADNANERIREVSTLGVITTVAGDGSAGFSGDGSAATAAKIKDPAGVTMDMMGNMYIADYNNHRIRKVNGSPTLGVHNINTVSEPVLYPNPNDGVFIINIPSAADEPVQIVVMDVTGKIVAELAGVTNKNLNLHVDVVSGVYYMYATTGRRKWEKTIILDKSK